MNCLPPPSDELKSCARSRMKDILDQKRPFLDSHCQEKLRAHLLSFLKDQSGCWGGFQPMPQEPNWTSIVPELPSLSWAFPKIKSKSLKLEFFKEVETLVPGSYGIREPGDGLPVEVSDLQGFLIPGMAFSRQGVRLGRGRGYFDRSLENYQGIRVGVCFSVQVVETDLPRESHDLLMTHIVTETGVFETRIKE